MHFPMKNEWESLWKNSLQIEKLILKHFLVWEVDQEHSIFKLQSNKILVLQ